MTHFDHTTPRARKPHRCQMCRRQINPGETYRRGVGMDGGTAWTFKECAHCVAFVEYAQALTSDYEYDDDLLVEFEPATIPEARVRGQYRRQWRRLDGSLYPVPEIERRVDGYGFGRVVGIAPGGAA